MYSECIIGRHTYILTTFDLETRGKSIVYTHYILLLFCTYNTRYNNRRNHNITGYSVVYGYAEIIYRI